MDLNTLVEQSWTIDMKIKELDVEAKKLGMELKEIQNKIMEIMKDQQITSLKHARGTVIMNARFTVKTPKEKEDKEAFFEYLKSKGMYDDMVSVNSQTLNSWYKEEMEAAKREGNFGFKIPGIGDPTAFEYISFRKS